MKQVVQEQVIHIDGEGVQIVLDHRRILGLPQVCAPQGEEGLEGHPARAVEVTVGDSRSIPLQRGGVHHVNRPLAGHYARRQLGWVPGRFEQHGSDLSAAVRRQFPQARHQRPHDCLGGRLCLDETCGQILLQTAEQIILHRAEQVHFVPVVAVDGPDGNVCGFG